MSKKACFAVSAVFLVFIAFFFVLNLMTPDIAFSEQENRYLETRPKFSFSALFSGNYIKDYESTPRISSPTATPGPRSRRRSNSLPEKRRTTALSSVKTAP